MAEAIFNNLTKDLDFTAYSCGIYGDGVSPVSNNAKEALREIGIDCEHISTPVTKEIMNEADYIIGMTANHSRTLISMFPEHEDKIYTMPVDISDPYGGNIEIYRHCRNQLSNSIKEIIKTILGDRNA